MAVSLCHLRFRSWSERTQVLDILVEEQRNRAALSLSTLLTGAIRLEDHDAICCSRGDESSTVAVSSPGAVRVECDVA